MQCAEDQEAMLEESRGPVYDAKQPDKTCSVVMGVVQADQCLCLCSYSYALSSSATSYLISSGMGSMVGVALEIDGTVGAEPPCGWKITDIEVVMLAAPIEISIAGPRSLRLVTVEY
jgi:hypothetical protein